MSCFAMWMLYIHMINHNKHETIYPERSPKPHIVPLRVRWNIRHGTLPSFSNMTPPSKEPRDPATMKTCGGETWGECRENMGWKQRRVIS